MEARLKFNNARRSTVLPATLGDYFTRQGNDANRGVGQRPF